MRRALMAMPAAALLFLSASTQAADGYPRTIVANAKATSGATTITSIVQIRIDRLVEPARRDRVIKGLKQNGYQGFMDAIRPLPAIGAIKTQNAEVVVKYAWETPVADKRRLVVVADKPLFFLPDDKEKGRAGYQLTVVQLLLDDHFVGSGLMAGAARVKPSPDEGVILEDYAVTPVDLTVLPVSK